MRNKKSWAEVENCFRCGGSGREFESVENDTPCKKCGKLRKQLAKQGKIGKIILNSPKFSLTFR